MTPEVTIVNTRPEGRSAGLTLLLRQAGFKSIEIPMIAITPFEGEDVSRVPHETYNGVFFSSINGTNMFLSRLAEDKMKPWLAKPVYTLSPHVAEKWIGHGGPKGFCSKRGSLRGFLDEYTSLENKPGQVWLHPCSLMTRLNVQQFREAGIAMRNLPVYVPALPEDSGELLREKLPGAHGVIFTSGSAVDNFFNFLMRSEKDKISDIIKAKAFFALGPSASEALERNGVSNAHQAERPKNDSLIETVKTYYGEGT
ncbi:uroporphyrinogen-III synthase [Fibrobacterota bacterium]